MPFTSPARSISRAARSGAKALTSSAAAGHAAAVAGVLGAQTMIQAVNLSIGLLILRHMGLREYAIYTIAGALVGIGAVLANMSLHSAVGYRVARAAEDRARLTAIVSSASTLQYALIALAGAVVVAIGATYRHQFASSLELGVTLAIVVLHIALAGRLELVRSVLYALGRLRPVFSADAVIASARAAVIAPLLFASPWIGALPILLGNAGAQMAGFLTLRIPPPRGVPGDLDRREVRGLLRYMAPLWPENLYYLLQGNIAALLLAWVGGHAQVAELGALTRLMQIVLILTVLNRAVVQPYVARYRSPADFRGRALSALGIYALGGAALLLLAWGAPAAPLLILGAQYAHLAPYVLPTIALGVVSLGGTLAYWLCLSSGNTVGLSLTVPFGIAIQLAYLASVGITTVGSALGFMLLTASGELVTRLGVLAWLFRRSRLPAPGASDDA